MNPNIALIPEEESGTVMDLSQQNVARSPSALSRNNTGHEKRFVVPMAADFVDDDQLSSGDLSIQRSSCKFLKPVGCFVLIVGVLNTIDLGRQKPRFAFEMRPRALWSSETVRGSE